MRRMNHAAAGGDERVPAVRIDRQLVLTARVAAQRGPEPLGRKVLRRLGTGISRGKPVGAGARRTGTPGHNARDPLIEGGGDQRLLAVAGKADDCDLSRLETVAAGGGQQVIERPAGEPGLRRNLAPGRLRSRKLRGSRS